MSERKHRWLLGPALLVVALLIASCGGASEEPADNSLVAASPSWTPSPSHSPSPEGVWFAEPPSPYPQEEWDEELEDLGLEDPPDGDIEIAPDLEAEFEDIEGTDPDIEGTDPEGEGTPDLDPCELVTESEWETFAGAASAGTMPLEDGDVCGYLTENDNIRLAVGAFAWAAGPRLVGGQDAFEEIEPGVYWAAKYPVEQSSMLVVEMEGWDLGFEVSTRTEDLGMRDRLLELAAVASWRLP